MPGAGFLFVLTLAKATGWPEDFILYELPVSRALGYYHAITYMENGTHWTVKPGTSTTSDHSAAQEDQLDELEALEEAGDLDEIDSHS